MASAALIARPRAVLRFGGWDGLLILLAVVQGVAVLQFPSIALIAVALWWNANTISHNFIHRPFFSKRALNLLFSSYLSVLLGFPQSVWRDRHLAHHVDARHYLRATRQILLESLLVLALWMILAVWNPLFFLWTYIPGYFAGLGLCALQGHYEHAPVTTSHYGAIYNLLCFNDGYHAEHHLNPATHWRDVPLRMAPSARSSRWPALLRWLDALNLETLEKLVLKSPSLQRFVLACHKRAFASLITHLPPVERIAIVGGGLFPRTALILTQLMPWAEITIIDASLENLERAHSILSLSAPEPGNSFNFVNEWFEAGQTPDCDLLVIPLALKGAKGVRSALYHQPPTTLLVHEWIWRPRGVSRIVSPFLLKRLNLVTPE